MSKKHNYSAAVTWTGNTGNGTIDAASYERSHVLSINNKVDIQCSSDTPFRGDGTKHNPEDMFLYSLSSCHMLWYLHLCADAGVVVTQYTDNATGTMIQHDTGGGHFEAVVLHPVVTITDKTKKELALSLHDKANEKCFIANSCNFSIEHEPKIIVSTSL